MSKSKAEQEREYYNQKLIREGVKEELSNPFSPVQLIEDFIQNALGAFLGLGVIWLLGSDHIHSDKDVRLIISVLVLAAAVSVVRAVFASVKNKPNSK